MLTRNVTSTGNAPVDVSKQTTIKREVTTAGLLGDPSRKPGIRDHPRIKDGERCDQLKPGATNRAQLFPGDGGQFAFQLFL